MEFTLTHDYPAGLDRLWAVFGRPQYAQKKYSAMGATAIRLDRFHCTADALEVELERDIAVDKSRLPAWARRFIGDAQTLRHRTMWRRVGPAHVTADLDISPVGLPVRAHAVGAIVQTRDGVTRMQLNWRVHSPLPILGEKVERLFAEQIQAALDEDHAFTLQYLQQVPPG